MRKDSPYYAPSIKVLQNATLFHGVDKQMMPVVFMSLTGRMK